MLKPLCHPLCLYAVVTLMMADNVYWSPRQRMYHSISSAPSVKYPLTPHQSQYLPASLLVDDSADPQAAQIAAGELGLLPYSRRRHAALRRAHSTVTHASPECSGRIAVVSMHDLASSLLPGQAEGRHDERCCMAAGMHHQLHTGVWSSIRLPV